ncbi:hypothetical protein [Arthrobacter crystallopoietes]|uniref:hypothetical protein n=1 Tax=Crystallibacter crystallopoietes TaxID=37928 RepID=UPI001486E61A|nr:hypothetical protein [Arthrobacter crystallopoietes]
MLGIGLTIGGAALAGADAAQQDGWYLSGPVERNQSTGYALTAPSLVIDPGQAGLPGAPPLSELASIRVQVSSVVPGQDIFVGIGEASAVSAYLDGVPHDSMGDFSWPIDGERPGTFSGTPGETDSPAGERAPAKPAGEDFWAASASGLGTQEITWDLQPGRWSLVVMNADASRPVWADVQAGARSQLLGPAGQAN